MLSFIYLLLQIGLTLSRVESRYVSGLLPKPHNVQRCEIDDGMPIGRFAYRGGPRQVSDCALPELKLERNFAVRATFSLWKNTFQAEGRFCEKKAG
jgi:hypothetical protein